MAEALGDIVIKMKPQGAVLAAYMRSRARVSLIMGPIGSGKTFQSCQKIFKLMCEQRPNRDKIRKSRWYAVRNTYSDLLSTTVKDWLELFGDLGDYRGPGAEPPSHKMRFRLEDGTTVQSEIVFLALDREEHVKKLRGVQATGFWLNEVKELHKAIVDMCDGRHGRYPSIMDGGPSWHGMIGDTNAPDDDHWYYELAEEIKPDEWEFFRQPGGVIWDAKKEKWIENPNAENIELLNRQAAGYYIKMVGSKDHDWIKVNLANEYGSVQSGKPVYRGQWNDSLHVAKDELLPMKGQPIIIGLDFGLTPCAIVGQPTPRGQLRIIDEFISDGMGIRQFCKSILIPILKTKYNGLDLYLVGDPAGNKRSDTDERTVFEEMYDLGLDAEPAESNSPAKRQEAVRYYLTMLTDGKPAFLLSPHCKVLRKGFNGGYQYRRLRVPGETRYTDEPDKNRFSHPHDGLQYLCLQLRSGLSNLNKATMIDKRDYT